MFLTVFPLFMPESKSLPSLFAHLLFFKDRLERYAPVALYKRTTMNDLHMLLMTKDVLILNPGAELTPRNVSQL